MELKAVLLIAVAMLGMCYALLGSLKLALAERLEITEDKVGGLVAAFGFMVGPVILLCGFLTDKFGRRRMFLVDIIAFIVIGVGLLYRQGYFQQYLNNDGWQQEVYPENDFYNMWLNCNIKLNITNKNIRIPGG